MRTIVSVAALAALLLVAGAHTYVVQHGDTLSGIAKRVGTTVRALTDSNGIADPDRIRVGQRLQIPASGGVGGGRAHHVVRPGESLSQIAARYGVTVADLARVNGIVNPSRVLAGARIRVAEASAAPAVSAGTVAPVATAEHVVQRGESLSVIAARYGVTVADLAGANAISDPNRLLAGTRLTIPGGWRCPVQGAARFVNDYGYRKPDGRFHDGIDLFAPRGTPVVASVAGVATQREGSRGGLQVQLDGVDGHRYYATHLDAFGAAGQVQAGTVIGRVGTSGNAAGTDPHLHFEMHDSQGPVNPYPVLLA
ncbi:MAG: M23 family metallopeptidase, partial [Actinomycetota bacterium]|nr:M23 family metallopeptidase [Actinomycetota bacterium]